MRLLLLSVLPAALLAGCAGNALDYTKPKAAILAPELRRYDFAPAQAKCLAETLGESLTVLQMRKFARVAGVRGRNQAGPLTVRDLIWRAAQAGDVKVPVEAARAADTCGLTAAPAGNPALAESGPGGAPGADSAAKPAIWINLGAAPTGQSIAINGSSIEADAAYRKAWFRVTNPGQAEPSPASYLLSVDCTARTINSLALRKRAAAAGAPDELRDYGPAGEGALPIEAGTVMEIAWLALCT